jgi:hypothetical protein
MHLLGGFGVAGKTGFGHIRTRLEGLLQFLEFAVISRGGVGGASQAAYGKGKQGGQPAGKRHGGGPLRVLGFHGESFRSMVSDE